MPLYYLTVVGWLIFTKSLKFKNMKRSTYVSKRLFIFILMIIIGSLAAGCKSCKKEEKEEAKDDNEANEDNEDKGENDSDVIITDAMLASVEAAINDSGKGP